MVLRAIPACRKDGVRTASELTSKLRRRIIRKVGRIVRQVIERIFRHSWRVTRHPRRVTRHSRRVTRHPRKVTKHPGRVTTDPRRVTRHSRRVAGHSRRDIRHATTLQRRLLKRIAEIYVMENILEHVWPYVLSVSPRAISTSWVDGFRAVRELT